MVCEVAAADEVGRACQYVGGIQDSFQCGSILDGVLGIAVCFHKGNLSQKFVEVVLEGSNLLGADDVGIGTVQLVEAPAVPNRPVAIEVEAVLNADVDAVTLVLDNEVERLVPVEAASEILVAGSQ